MVCQLSHHLAWLEQVFSFPRSGSLLECLTGSLTPLARMDLGLSLLDIIHGDSFF